MKENKYDNASRYIYTGPSMLIPWAKPSRKYVCVNEGTEVVAEMSIAKGTVIAVHRCGVDILTEPVFIASEYLKLKPIHFDPKDDEAMDYRKKLIDFCCKHRMILNTDVKCGQGTIVTVSRAGNTVVRIFDRDSGKAFREAYIQLVAYNADKKYFTPKKIKDLADNLHIKDDPLFKDGVLTYEEHTVNGFDKVLNEMSATHKAKNHDYGNSFTDLFKECGMTYAYGHLKEKLERIRTLMKSRQQVKQESMLDSLYDLANYAVMTIVELKKKQDDVARD